ncbi:MAG TPA: protein kinase [Thermoanaerobaculia bacterium]|nr:protein kinase [Thermoanaerobaculia bacterium]
MVSSTPDGWGSHDLLRVGEIVLAAAALEPQEREAYLRQVTMTQPLLLAVVRRRLELAAELPDSFLAVPAAELLEAAEQARSAVGGDPTDQEPSHERYEPGDCLGEGGMARVYKAFDQQLQRPVALKLLDRAEPESRRRFLREAQAQARVRHDNVLEVYETGELAGTPFIAMRWVDGPTLLAIRDETSLEQKIRLIAQVAEGLHAAHREGLIHRDVKPSNVLVERTPDGDWKPWIADFGIAQWSEAGASGELAGTPAYLAPELLRNGGTVQADRRADVYGLGVTLYELLTGETPFHAPELTELLRQVRDDAPPPPRRLLPSLPADLEAIVLKCLEKDPEARYPSARALAEDLWRFLDGEVVEAHAASLSYRLTRFALRHRRLLTVAGVAAVLLVIALSVAAVLGVAARVANRRAELRRGQAEDLIGFMLTDLRDKLDPLGKLEILDDVGKRAMAYFAAVPQKELSDDELARRSQALYQIGDVRIRRGDLAGAVKPLQESLALAQALASRSPTRERLFGLGQSHFWVGYVQWEQGDLAAARPHFEAYRDLSERLVHSEPGREEYQLELADAYSNLGSLLRQQGDRGAALASFQKTLALNQALVARSPANLEWRFELAATHDLIGHTLIELGRLAEALPHFEANLTLRQALVQQEPGNRKYRDFLGTAHDSLAVWHEDRGRVAEALGEARASQDVFADLATHDPDNQLWRWKLELSRMKVGRLLLVSGETQQAMALLTAVAATTARRVEQEPKDRKWRLLGARAYIDLGASLAARRRDEEARKMDLQAVEWLDLLREKDPADRDTIRSLAKALLLLGRLDDRRGEPRAALAAWDRAQGLLAPIARGSHDVELLDPWASALLLLGRRDEARPTLAALAAAGYRSPWLLELCLDQGIEFPEPHDARREL